jgi:hypothetical protein
MATSFSGFAPGFVNYKKGCTRLAGASDKVYQLLANGLLFSPGTSASSTSKIGTYLIQGKCIGLYRMSEYSGFILVDRNTLGP